MDQNHGNIFLVAQGMATKQNVRLNPEDVMSSSAVSDRLRKLFRQIREQDEDVHDRCSSFYIMFFWESMDGCSKGSASLFPFSPLSHKVRRTAMEPECS